MIKLQRNRIVILTAIIVVVGGFLLSEYVKGSEPPKFQVAPVDDWVHSSAQWTPGATISLTIEDGSGVVYSDSQTADSGGNFQFNLWDVFDLQRGHVVTVSDGTTTKTHTVTNLFVDGVDVLADTVFGRADAGTSADVSVHDNGTLTVTADGSGNWTADFSGMTDLTYVSDGASEQTDGDGDSTIVFWASPAETLEIDIKPGRCPNRLNVRWPRRVKVAILGSEEFEVTQIKRASVRLEGVEPIGAAVRDVAGPVLEPIDVCDCTTERWDGFNDLLLWFNGREIVEALGHVNNRDELVLTLTGELIDGTPIEGQDCLVVVKRPRRR